MRKGMLCWAVSLGLAWGIPAWAADDTPIAWSVPHGTDNGEALRQLAAGLIPRYNSPDPVILLDTRAQLQIAAGRYDDALKTLAELLPLRRDSVRPLDAAGTVRWQIYARARQIEAKEGTAFGDAYANAFHEIVPPLENVLSSQVMASFGSDDDPYNVQPVELRRDFGTLLKAQVGKDSITQDNALALVKAHLMAEAYTAFRPYTDKLVAEDDARRYDVHAPVLVRTPDGVQVTARVMLPKKHGKPLPALLGFTVYANPVWSELELRLTAAHGYAAVVGYTRGKGISPDQAVPYEHDGADADAVIEWIAKQPWSDGRVGMYGGSYNGFTQWAAAKHRPKALRALMPSVTAAPGIDVPMEGNVFLSFVYSWVPYVTEGKALDQAAYDDNAHWQGLYRRWYESGKAYRDLDVLDGKPNPVFRRWLDHPSYDAYWQAMIPYKEEFANIDIPVLTTTGYFDGAQIGALYYLTQHYRYNPKADHYLLLGPWDHIGAQRSARPVVDGYAIDAVAKQDIGRVLRYQWFDYVFRGAPKPALLADRINYEVMGANTWKHAPTLAAMAPGHRRLYLANDGKALTLADGKGTTPATLTVDLGKRDDLPAPDAKSPELDDRNALVFTSEPLPDGTELSGLFSGHLDLVTNKHDFDLMITLYEKKADGSYFQLSWYETRASYAADRSVRKLLTPGKPIALDFTNSRTTSRRFEPGSRLVVTVAVVKGAGQQINMGTGNDVSAETAADAGEPLKINWLPGSFLDLPIGSFRH